MNPYIDEHKKGLLLRKFVLYAKSIAKIYANLQGHKRQLCEMIKDLNYIIPFARIDINKMGAISQKNLQTFLIQHKYYLKPTAIQRYFDKYSHGKQKLTYDDVLESFMAHSDYVLVATTLKKWPSHICHQTNEKLIENVTAFILNEEIIGLQKDYLMMNDITDGSLQIGATLWRNLDRNHCNELTYTQFQEICFQYGCQFSKYEWRAFINWHFGTHKQTLNRDLMMTLFNVHIQKKRSKSVCQYERYTMKEVQKKQCQQQLQRQKNVEEFVKTRVGFIHQQQKNKSQFRKIIDSQPFPDRTVPNKKILSGKKGYKVPTNCIKYIMEE